MTLAEQPMIPGGGLCWATGVSRNRVAAITEAMRRLHHSAASSGWVVLHVGVAVRPIFQGLPHLKCYRAQAVGSLISLHVLNELLLQPTSEKQANRGDVQ